MNRVDLVGRLVKEPELRYSQTSNRAVAQFTIAINRNYTNQDGEREADFPTIVVWDKQAENVNKYCHKGDLVEIEGRLQTRNYDGKDGKKVYVTEVVASRVGFLQTKRDDSNFQNLEEPPISNNNQTSFKAEEIDSMPAFDETDRDLSMELPF